VSNFVEFCDFFSLQPGDIPVIMGLEREVKSMRELFLQTLTLPDESGAIRSYDYSILIDEMDVGPYACESYGVRVVEQGGAEASAPHVTCSAARIDELSELLLRNAVTPTTFHDVLADWL
jgi:hypothetical protein